MAGEVDFGDAVVRVVIAPLAASSGYMPAATAARAARQLPCDWVDPVLASHPRVALLACAAAHRAESFVRACAPLALPLRVGRGPTHEVAGGGLHVSAASFEERLRACGAAESAMLAAFQQQGRDAASPAMRKLFALCAERVVPVPLAELPAELRGETTLFDDGRLATLPWAHRALITRRRAPPPRPPVPTQWPSGVEPPGRQRDVLEPGVFEDILRLLRDLDAWHSSGGALPRPRGRAWGIECFRHPYRELIADGAVLDWTSGECRLAGGDAPAFQSHVMPERAALAFQHSIDR